MNAPKDSDRKAAEASLEAARIAAAAYLPQLLEILTEKAIDPGATPKTVLDAAEFTYKVSGLAKRQEETKTGPTFSVRITLPGQNKEIVIGGGSASPTVGQEEPEPIEALPEPETHEPTQAQVTVETTTTLTEADIESLDDLDFDDE
jgi:hypothetical protein